ncbi:hypothetical protein [Nevskia ramosa]|nr:hypothetical protein [Nevskia ramosa]
MIGFLLMWCSVQGAGLAGVRHWGRQHFEPLRVVLAEYDLLGADIARDLEAMAAIPLPARAQA